MGDDAALIHQIIGLLVSAIGGLAALIITGIRTIVSRIRKLEDCTVKRKEFEELRDQAVHRDDFHQYMERAEKSRSEMRESVNDLSQKMDNLKDLIIRDWRR